MSKATFPYRLVNLSGSGEDSVEIQTLRPLVVATVIASNGESVRWLMLADSGADACVFPLSLAPMLKLNLRELPVGLTGGVGNQNNVTYYATLTIDLGFDIIFTAQVGFTAGIEDTGFGLLGQTGLFENYDVALMRRQQIFTVERV